MKYVVTSAEMKACDYGTTGQTGIPSMVLMERAALAVAEVIIKRYPDRNRILIVAGKGNNGGDGLAIGRLLAKAGRQVTFFSYRVIIRKKPESRGRSCCIWGFPSVTHGRMENMISL